MIAGGFDDLLKVRTGDLTAYRHVLGEKISALPQVAQSSTYVAMEAGKDEAGKLGCAVPTEQFCPVVAPLGPCADAPGHAGSAAARHHPHRRPALRAGGMGERSGRKAGSFDPGANGSPR